MAPESHARLSLCINPPANPTREQNKLAGQGPIRGFNAKSDEAPTKASIPLKAPTLPLILFFTEDHFTKFMKVFMETMQVQAQALTKPQKRPLNAKSPETYSEKSHMDYYHFC